MFAFVSEKFTDLFEKPCAGTTPYTQDAEITPRVNVVQISTDQGYQGELQNNLPRSSPVWDSHEYLTKLFGEELMNSIPTVGVTSGATDYLDLVQGDDFVDADGNPACIIKGIDPFKRHFVSFGVEMTNENKMYRYIYTIFRRYTNPESIWVICKSHYSDSNTDVFKELMNHTTEITEDARKKLGRIIDQYKSGNNGIEMSYMSYNYKTCLDVKQTFTVKLYSPYQTST